MVKLPGEPLTPVADAITGATGSETQHPVFEVIMREFIMVYSTFPSNYYFSGKHRNFAPASLL